MRAVFLSYASQDAAPARRIADALQAAGIEVWLDQSELRGGDAWDAKIREQIRDCTLFVPIISANTQARREAYFRLEWKLAEERTHLMAKGTPFLMPVVIDETSDRGALAPDAFLSVQWTRVPGGAAGGGLVERVKALLDGIAVAAVVDPGPAATRPATEKRSARVWWLAGALVLASGIASWFAWPRAASPPAIAEKSIAVLPFTNMSDDKANAFFADGVQEDLLTNLANLRDLKVISRTSVMGYRETTKTIQQIGRELGVAYVLEGSVRRAGNKVRVTGQLIKTADDQHLWAQAYDREIDDIFAIQAALAKEIATALHAALTPADVARLARQPTDNAEAYDVFLQGRAVMHSGSATPEILARAQPLFERAVQLDPRFGLAWTELARVHLAKYVRLEHSAARLASARTALDAAVRFAPDELEVMLAQIDFYSATADGVSAETVKQRLARTYPHRPEVMMLFIWGPGGWREALANLRKIRALDPRNPDLLDQMSLLFLTTRHYDEAAALKAQANALLPSSYLRSSDLALIPFLARGETGPMESLLAEIPAEARRTDRNAIIALANWAYNTGDTAGLIRLWEESGDNWRFSPNSGRLDLIAVAQAFIVLGEPDRARPLLEKNRDQLAADLADEPENFSKWDDLSLVEALLGNATASTEAAQKRAEIVRQRGWSLPANPAVLAWRGEKEAAITVLASTMVQAGNWFENNVHFLRRAISHWPLQGDPRFEALLDDPKINTPIF